MKTTRILLVIGFAFLFGAVMSHAKQNNGYMCGEGFACGVAYPSCYPLSGTCLDDQGQVVDFTRISSSASYIGHCIPGNGYCVTSNQLGGIIFYYILDADNICTQICGPGYVYCNGCSNPG